MKSFKTILMLLLVGCSMTTLHAQPLKSRVQKNKSSQTAKAGKKLVA